MNYKELKFSKEARESISKGVKVVASAVKCTLGPHGRTVIIESPFGGVPRMTKDGVSVAKDIDLKDKFENLGAQLVKEAATKTVKEAGDGTTTATVLAEAIYLNGLKAIEEGHSAQGVKRGIERACDIALSFLPSLSQPVNTSEKLLNVAILAANGDVEIGKIVAEAFQKVGKDGVVYVEESKGFDTTIEFTEGLKFDRGYISPHFATNQETMACEYNDALVLVYEKKISSMHNFISILQKAAETGKALLIICEDVDGEALPTLVVNKIRNGLKVVVVRPPNFGDMRTAMMEDIAIQTGATFIREETGLKLESANLAHLGKCKKLVVTKDDTTIIGGDGAPIQVKERIAHIKNKIEDEKSDYAKIKLQERLAKFCGGIAIIKVGAVSETALKEKKDRVEDSKEAAKSALQEGIVAGAGKALASCHNHLDCSLKASDAEIEGFMALRKALLAPIKQICANASLNEAEALKHTLTLAEHHGYNAATGHPCDLFKEGIVDPTKVVRCALKNAAAVAAILLTTECLIVEQKDLTQNPNPNPTPY